jgi:hypothetical protein
MEVEGTDQSLGGLMIDQEGANEDQEEFTGFDARGEPVYGQI